MADQLTSAGLEIDPLDVRTDRVKNTVRTDISSNMDLSSDQPSGQFVEIFCEELQQSFELIQEIHTAQDPNQATGKLLSMLTTLTGSKHREATKGTVTLTLNLDGATTILAGKTFQVSGETDNRWVTNTDFTSPVGAAADYDFLSIAQNAGAIQALSPTITVIVNPQAGLNSCTNALDATPGLDTETETELRLRREQEAFLPGSANVLAQQSQLSAIDEIISVVVYENTKWFSQLGMPPNSTQAVIWDGSPAAADDDEIARTIFEQKAGGPEAYGTTNVTYTDAWSNDHVMGFARATVVYILCDITLERGDNYVGDTVVQSTINNYIEVILGTDGDVLRADIVQLVKELEGVANIDLNLLLLSRKPAGTALVDIAIDRTEKAMVEVMAADIVVTS